MKFRPAAFLVLCVVLSVAVGWIYHKDDPRYEGRTVEQWLRSPDWKTRKDYVALVITDFEDQGTVALNRILLRKGAATEEALLAAGPLAKTLNGSRLTRAEMKERVITSLESFGMTGLRCFPTLQKLAQNENESLRVRQLAIKTLARIAGSDATKEALSFLTNSPTVGSDAMQAIAAIDRQRLHQREISEISEIRHEMDKRDTNQANGLTSRSSLWGKEEPGLHWKE